MVAALMVLVLPAGLTRAAPLAPSAGAAASWAYGGVASSNFSGTSRAGVPYVGNATAGFTVRIDQVNVSANEFELTVNRTAGVAFAIKYCSPTCKDAVYFASLSARFWESEASVSFLVTNGSVDESSGPASAVALLGSSTWTQANETEWTTSYLPVIGSAAAVRSSYLAASLSSNTSIAFSTPLGLFPENLTGVSNWSSSATFAATVQATYHYLASHTGATSWSYDGSGSLPVSGNGTLAVDGSRPGSGSVSLGGTPFPEVALTSSGAFGLVDGVVVVPVGAELFRAGGSLPWAGNESGEASGQMSFVDIQGRVGGHFGLGASRWVYDAQALEPTSSVAGAVTGSAQTITALSGTGTPDSAPATTVQGQPQSTAQSDATQACLLTGAGCPAAGGGPAGGLRGLLGLGVVLVAVGAVVAAAVILTERRRMPPPVYPNATLYPPGAATTFHRAGSEPEPSPAPPDDDPLSNLW